MKQQFPVEDESKIFPSVFRLQNWAANVQYIERGRIKDALGPREIEDFCLTIF